MTAAHQLAINDNAPTRQTALFSPRSLFRLAALEADFAVRGFNEAAASRPALEKIGETFIGGYNAALAADNIGEITRYVEGVSLASRGFAAEGATMAAAIADALSYRQPLLPACIEAFNDEFTYLAHVGAGWALARIPWRRRNILAPLDPVHRWLAFDGLGFHDTYFKHRRILAGWRRRADGYAARAYDQGVGRALWFVAGGCIGDVVGLVAAFPAVRQGDLWSGIGLAMTYAGPAGSDDIVAAVRAAGANAALYAQGVAFACEARCRAGYLPAHANAAAYAVAGCSAQALTALVRQARDRLPAADGDLPRYELWRQDVAACLRPHMGRPS
jgi:hypothetical protein